MPGEGRVRRIELGIVLFSETTSNYALEWFSEAGSAPIRSAVKFYFDTDVRIFFQEILYFYFNRKFSKNHSVFEILKHFDFFRFFQLLSRIVDFSKKIARSKKNIF